MTRVILDEHDVDQLLRMLYKGQRPLRVHTLICACGAYADLREDACAWNGWQLFPHALCPACTHALVSSASVEAGRSPLSPGPTPPALARARFKKLVDQLTKGGGFSAD